MVSSLFIVPDELSKLGHDVTVLSDVQQGGVTRFGVKWITEYPDMLFDILILNRGIGHGYPQINAKHRILWTHDLPHAGFIPNPKMMGAFSATVFMSAYAERVWRTYYPVIGKSWTIPNGVNRELFHPRMKDPNYLIYCSAPNRGTERLPLIYAATKARTELPLRMRAYTNMAKLHPNECKDDSYALNYKTCEEAGIAVLDPIPQTQLAEELGMAGAMIMPTIYPEICSNVVLQSLASGTPVFTTGNLGATREWVEHGKNGMLTEFQPHDYMVYQMEMVRNLVKVISNPRVHRKMMNKAAQTKGIFTWQQIGQKWHKMISRLS
jgi:glycosyltransferase involved in cell wall biosynthesis